MPALRTCSSCSSLLARSVQQPTGTHHGISAMVGPDCRTGPQDKERKPKPYFFNNKKTKKKPSRSTLGFDGVETMQNSKFQNYHIK